jgi:hypothetical protein
MKYTVIKRSNYPCQLSERLLLLARVRTSSLCDRRQTALPPAVRTGVSSVGTTRAGKATMKNIAFLASLQSSSGPSDRKRSCSLSAAFGCTLLPVQAVYPSRNIQVTI